MFGAAFPRRPCAQPFVRRQDLHFLGDSYVLGPRYRSRLVFLFALFRELVSPCCPLEGASLSSPLCLPTRIITSIV